MNYVIEDNINFYDELNNSDDDDINCCLISGTSLDKNKIKLDCGHEFNFNSLYNEVVSQKMKNKYSHYSSDKLSLNQIKCPYCRNVQNKLLPHIKLNKDFAYITGVNTPKYLCMPFHTCQYSFKSGKRKNEMCCNTAYYDVVNKLSDSYCTTHHKNVRRKNNKIFINNTISNNTVLQSCNGILKSGKRKGETCNCKTYEGSDYCKKHMPK
jgi:hypothetical protein